MNSGRVFKYNLTTIFFVLFTSAVLSQECKPEFYLPAQGALITTPSCTLEVKAPCNIKRVLFKARYTGSKPDSSIIVNLGTVSKAPFMFVWDISKIPNQLISGVSFLAEVTLANWSIKEINREGVFFLHQNTERLVKTIPYDHQGTLSFNPDTFTFKYPRSPGSITTSMYWNEKDLSVLMEVNDPLFYDNIPRDILAGMGLEVLLDPTMSRKPYPHKDIMAYSVPLHGKPYRIIYQPVFESSGSFKLNSQVLACDFKYKVTRVNFKGYKIYFSIPLQSISDTLPKEIACNLIVKSAISDSIVRSPWINYGALESYSPYVWGSIQFQPKPFFKNSLLVWSIFFVLGLLLMLLIQLLIRSISKSTRTDIQRRSEAEEKMFEKIKDAMERRITQKDSTKNDVARDLKISPKKLNSLIKGFTGLSFQNYMMLNRTEIAKERLRSSHCNEATVAEACGFQNAPEMEKYFMKFHRITPGKFRSEQQVA